ncbi:hypothetical protein THAOC_09743 [Thalassiosira oceanica]|uniref:RING-type domain-containing protein n=1 Tax=Thalassiosira oceanica TaxID=159749 RepID=K0SVR5_THAOC|nr:hypothetical protein THAOC_09743 [Thalassiosira oceanica]|eukprot:EJK69039.1 hypothetical protein THAOC_09743 [Thalassiosira oceanica]
MRTHPDPGSDREAASRGLSFRRGSKVVVAAGSLQFWPWAGCRGCGPVAPWQLNNEVRWCSSLPWFHAEENDSTMEPIEPLSAHLCNSSNGSLRLETSGSSGSNDDSNDTPNTPTHMGRSKCSSLGLRRTMQRLHLLQESARKQPPMAPDSDLTPHFSSHDGDLEDQDAKACFSADAHKVFFARDRGYSSPEELVEKIIFERGTERADLCPGCGLLLPLDRNEKDFYRCCLREYCNGCILEIVNKMELLDYCPMCRKPVAEEADENANSNLARYLQASQGGNPMATWMLGE